MYPVSEDYKIKIKENERIFDIKITINHSKGQLELYDKDLVHGSLIYKESTQSGDDFTIGGTVASDIELKIFNKEEYDNIVFVGATIFVDVGLLVEEGVDAHFLQPSQPSKMKDFDDKVEYVRLGKFHIDIANRLTNTIELKAIDSMILLDKPYDLSKLSYPATLYQIYTNICHIAQLPIGTQKFTNMNYIVKSKPTGDLSLRSILGYVAELSGTFAKVNRNGALELRWYEQTDLNIEPNNRFKLELSDDVVQIKGILVRVKENEDDEDEDEVVYLTGSDEYTIDLSENPLLQDEYDVVLPNILNNIKDTIFIPYTAECQSNPAIESGDIIKHTTIDGKVVDTIVTKLTYKYMGKSTLEANGLPEVTKDFKGSTDRKITLIKNKIDKEIDTKLTGVEQAQLNATELMSNMLGGHLIEDKKNGIIYIADNPDIDKATKIWKWGTGGFGYSDDGGETWTTAITADGSIVAELVSAGIITADMIKAGQLQSQNGRVIFDLDNNDFRTPNIVMNKDGIIVSNGAIVVKDVNNSSIITSNGLKIKHVFMSSGTLNGWQRCGIWQTEGWGEKHSAFITVAIPEEFSIETALLRTKSMPRYFEGWDSYIPDGFYHSRNLRLYKVNTPNDGYVDFPAYSGYGIVMGGAGKTNITNAVWGISSWSPTGSTIQTREGDVKNYLQPGTNTFLVETTDELNDSNDRYGGAMQFELIVTGYLRG